MRPMRFVALAVVAAAGLTLAACGGKAAPAPPAGSADTPSLAFTKYTLPNGLTVILSEDHRLPLVAVDVWYHVGPAYEAAGRTGFAHLFEHMMFQGSKHVPGDSHFKLLEAAGGTNYNGTTDFDRTNYFENLPANQLELGLFLESDRMGYLLDDLDELKLANQQDVVRNERRESTENTPYGVVGEAVFHQLFPKTHPYYADVIGSHADIQAAKLEDVKNFFKTYYTPNNASLTIVGDFDAAKTKDLVAKYFGTFKRGPDVPAPSVQTPPITSERKVVVKDHIDLPRVYDAWITPSYFKPGDADADLAAGILGGGHSSRLYKSLVYDKQIAQDVFAQQQSLMLGSVFQIVATARPGHTADEVQKAIDDELDKLRAAGPDAKEVTRAENTFETRLITPLEVLGGFGGVADTLSLYNHYIGDPGYLGKDLERHRAVTAASVKGFVNQYLAASARVVVDGVPGDPDLGAPVPTPPMPRVKPGTGAESVNADEAWRAQPPKPAPAKPANLPAPATFTLPNGLTVLYTPRTGIPVTSATLVLKSGGDTNPLDKPGLANFVAALLDQGTATRNATQIADDSAQVGASIEASSSKDAITVTAQSLSKNFPATLDLLADIVQHPSFPAAEIDRQRASIQAELVQAEQDPDNDATMVAIRALYGPKSTYGYSELGTAASVRVIGAPDLQGFWKQNFVPNNAALVVSGTLSEADVKSLIEKSFGAWQKGTPAPPTAGTMTPTAAKVVFVDRPGAQQSQIRVIRQGAARSAADFPALQTMNLILGGLFSSRINLNLREDHGYTYGAYTQFILRKTPGPFLAASGVRTDVTAPALAEMVKELTRITVAPVTADELAMGKDAFIYSMPSDFETSLSTVSSLGNIYLYDLGLDYYAKLPGRVSAVTGDDVLAAARKYLGSTNAIAVVVGDRAKVMPGLTALHLGAVELRKPDGSVAPGK